MCDPIRLSLILCLLALPATGLPQSAAPEAGVLVVFAAGGSSFSAAEKIHIENIIRQSETEVRALLPRLPDLIKVTVFPLDKDVSSVGGVVGSADTPNTVSIRISTRFEGGVIAASNTGLAAALYHEFHHLARGWTIEGNQFGPGIPTAAINEGLANVFSETHTRTAFAGNASPENACQWWHEINTLPLDASYGDWMVRHPDGRDAIGYRAGSFVIRQALANSGLSIVELSNRSITEIRQLITSCHE